MPALWRLPPKFSEPDFADNLVLEDVYKTQQKLMTRGNTTAADRQTLEIDAIFIGHNIRDML
jgi:hypothetical protein